LYAKTIFDFSLLSFSQPSHMYESIKKPNKKSDPRKSGQIF